MHGRAVIKDKPVRYAIFEGLNHRYPHWFQKAIVDHTYVDEFNYPIYGLDSLVEGFDVFLMNFQGEIYRIDIDLFNANFMVVNHDTAVLNARTVEYYIFDINKRFTSYPDWVMQAIADGIIARRDGWIYFYDENGDVALDPSCVFLRNFQGQIRYLEYKRFKDLFYTVSI